MCQGTVTTITPPVTVVCSSATVTTMTLTIAPVPMQLASASVQHDVALPPPLILRDTIRGVAGLTTMPHQ